MDNIIIDSIIQIVGQLVEEEIGLVEFDLDYLLLLLIYRLSLALIQNQFLLMLLILDEFGRF
jgi:hypothetical protein